MKNNLNEEISRIKKLLNINENTLILEANPILNLIRKLAPSLEGKFISSVETKLGGKKIAAASEAEIKAAFKSAELAAIRKEIGDAIYTSNKSTIDAIYGKYNMSAAGESAKAYSELSALNSGEFAGIAKELGRSYRAAKGSTGAGAGTGSGTGNVTNTAGKYTGNLMDKLGKRFGGRIDDVNLQKLKDPNSKLRLDLENELIAAVGKEKSGLVNSAINKAVARVAKITEGLTEQEAYNKVFETALTKMGIKSTTNELIQKHFGWLFKFPWYGKAIIYSLILNEVVNPLLGTKYSLWETIKYVAASVVGGAVGSNQLDGALERLKKSSETPENNSPQGSSKDVTTY
jgi:hypothetical protein